ncbi:MAG: hypothetical protein HXX20_21415 [Chloroflexi bacterium]|nr:hypothetical protein [Chloroflexota bacterium]
MGIFILFTANLVLCERLNGQKTPQSGELFALFRVSLNSYVKLLQIRQDQATATSWRTIPQILAFRLECGYGKLF